MSCVHKTLSILCGSFFIASGAHANLLINGSFEGGTHTGSVFSGGYVTLSSPSTAINGWSITAGSADWIYKGVWQPSDGDYSIDMSGLSAGTLESDYFSTVAGQTYQVTFDMAGNFANQVLENSRSKGMHVAVGDASQDFWYSTPYPDSYAADPIASMYPNMHWQTQTLHFMATSSQTRLVFTSHENSAYGAVLDNVSITAVSSVPEPTNAIFMLSGVALLGAAQLRKRA